MFVIRRGQTVNWRLTMTSGNVPADMTGGQWGIAETTFRNLPTLTCDPNEAWVKWTADQTSQMTTGRKRLRLKFTQPNGEVRVFPDLWVTVE